MDDKHTDADDCYSNGYYVTLYSKIKGISLQTGVIFQYMMFLILLFVSSECSKLLNSAVVKAR